MSEFASLSIHEGVSEMTHKSTLRFRRSAVAVAASFMFVGAADAALMTYGSGTLATTNSTLVCAIAACPWGVPSTLTYSVGFDNTKSVNGSTGAWFYSYSWVNQATAQQGALSHFSIEVSSGTNPAGVAAFSAANFLLDSLTPSGGYGAVQIGQDGSSPDDDGDGNPLYSLKYNRTSTDNFDNWAISFYSDRAPMWGDIFIKDGTFGEVYNAGYTAVDPAMQLSCTGGNCLELSKTGYNWLAVPDTKSVPDNGGGGGGSAPEPATVGLIGLGMLAIGALRRRKPIASD
jgi:hypothetical protein